MPAAPLKVLVRRETPPERRVPATPETVRKMVKQGFAVRVEAGAGAGAHLSDASYEEAGAAVGGDPATLWREADVILTVGPLEAPGGGEVAAPRRGAIVVGLLAPHRHPEAIRRLAEGGVTAFALELVPRISRAQGMDALSSQASIAGYKAVLVAAARLDRYFPLLMTAAGTILPSRVVVMGAGVAGLQAVATAKRLGAVVEVSDIRPAVKEQVESLGGRFIELPMAPSGEGTGGYARAMGEDFLRRQREIVARHVADADVVITTALVPGQPAPRLVSREMVEDMRPGAVIVDLAVAQGGNCELSRAGEEVEHRGVLVLAPPDLAATVPLDASTVYSRNVLAFLLHLAPEGAPRVDLEDEIVRETLVAHAGEMRTAAAGAPLTGVGTGATAS